MRKLIISNAMSLDGYYEGPGKNVLALFDYRWELYPTDESFDAYNAERLRAADTLVLGRVSYDGFKSFWPSVADDPNATPLQREISRLNNAIEKVVISDTLTSGETDPWHKSTSIIGRAEAHERIAELKGQTGKDILVFGSRTVWNDLLANDLVDELHFMMGPVVLGAGTPVFEGQPALTLGLIDTRTWDGSGNVLLRYEVSPPKDVDRRCFNPIQQTPGLVSATVTLTLPALYVPTSSKRMLAPPKSTAVGIRISNTPAVHRGSLLMRFLYSRTLPSATPARSSRPPTA